MSIFLAIYKEVFPTNPRAAAVKRVLEDKVSQYVDKDLFLPFLMWIVDPSRAGTPSDKLKDFFVKSNLHLHVHAHSIPLSKLYVK